MFLPRRVENVVGDAVGELVAVGAVGEQPAKRADDRVDRLAAERGQSVDQDDLAAEPRRLDRGGNAGDAGADHADIRLHLANRSALRSRRTTCVPTETPDRSRHTCSSP